LIVATLSKKTIFSIVVYMIHEFGAKKMGEVLAFNELGIDTIDRGIDALTEAFGEEKISDMKERFRMHIDTIVAIATEADVIDTTHAKAEKTLTKLKAMRDLYVGDQWHNAVELSEWSGFFEGAAIVHYAVIRGVAQEINNEQLLMLAEEAINWHYSLLELFEGELEQEGTDKSQL